ncbi:receptor-type tyrosine-protein phosphatase alpha-like [Ptychodera flava]|uniref:receptor-type tyrosine-protein phosphatase alpha-like n=1 Tax=Ptychodera flava TaxID=63121 RepID=UPI00396A153B
MSTTIGESTPTIKEFIQDEKPNSRYAATFTCTVQANEENMVVSLHTQTSVYTDDVTHGTHPNYEFINNFNDVVVTKDEIVICLLTPGDQQHSINADAYTQPVLTSDPWITDINENEMKVNWYEWDSSDDIGDDPIVQYELWYKVTGDDEFEEYDTTIPPQTTILVTELTAYTRYTFAVKTYRPGDGGGGDLGPHVTEHTLCDDPLGTPSVEAAMTISENEIMVFWEVDDADLETETLRCVSVTSYSVYYRVAGTQTDFDQRVVAPDETSFLLDGLDPCTEYDISLSMDNAAGNGQFSDSVFNTTLSSTPQEVEWLSADAVSSSDINITWSQPATVDCPLESYRLDFQQETTYECGEEQNFQSLFFDETQFAYLATDLYAFTSYKATITAHTNGGGGPPNSVTEETHEGVPSEPRNVSVEGVSETEIEVAWTAPRCPNGTVISYIILYWQSTDRNITNAVAAPQVCSNFTDALSCVIADLQPETNYSVKVSAENGCCFSAWSDTAQGCTITVQATPPASGSSVGVIVFTSITLTLVFILLILFLLGYLYTKRTGKSWREMFSKSESNEDLSDLTSTAVPSTNEYLYANREMMNPRARPIPAPKPVISKRSTTKANPVFAPKPMPKTKDANGTEYKTDKSDNFKPIRVEDLADYIKMKKSTGGGDGLNAEYKLLPGDQVGSCEVSVTDLNRQKNRFKNIVAYDHSRVILEPLDDDPNSDYINASFINGYKKKKSYIATQGPKTTTVNDLWRMIWQERSTSILMATNLKENNKEKCAKYWPDMGEGEIYYGKISVKNMNEELFADSVIRTFFVKKEGEARSREVKHFHFTVWPDMGVPQYPSSVLSFLQRFKYYTLPNAGPIIVHCSAGVGRTGTFITIDSMLEMAEAEGQVDIFNFVKKARHDRMHFVQVPEQYEFIYTAVLEATVCGDTQISAADLRIRLQKLKADDGSGKSGIENEFESLSKVCHMPSADDCERGKRDENFHKNRDRDIIPIDRFAPFLITQGEGDDATDYINASFLTAYTRKDAFIATQMPMEHTIVDFLRMVYDYKTNTIVMLNDMETDEMKSGKYWSENEPIRFGPFIVKVSATESYNGITERIFRLTYTPKAGKEAPRTITQLQVDWPARKEVPSSDSIMVDLISLVERAQQQSGDNPITVHCRNGIGRSGVFCAFYAVCEKIKVEQMVDVFQAVKTLRNNRPGMVETLTQYQYCYDAVLSYLDSFSAYSNFER